MIQLEYQVQFWVNWVIIMMSTHGDISVPSHRTDWGSRSFAVAGPSSWNALPVDLRSSSFGLDAFAKHLKTHLFGLAYSRQSMHFWVCITFFRVRHGDSVTKPDYYYYYYYYVFFGGTWPNFILSDNTMKHRSLMKNLSPRHCSNNESILNCLYFYDYTELGIPHLARTLFGSRVRTNRQRCL